MDFPPHGCSGDYVSITVAATQTRYLVEECWTSSTQRTSSSFMGSKVKVAVIPAKEIMTNEEDSRSDEVGFRR